MRLIDAGELKEQLEQIFEEANKWKNKTALVGDHIRYERADGAVAAYIEAIMTVNKAPTIDAVPVVRCKDCKYSNDLYSGSRLCCLWTEYGEYGAVVSENDYCSNGRRDKK